MELRASSWSADGGRSLAARSGGRGGLGCFQPRPWCGASARGPHTGRGAAMGPLGPGRRAARALAWSQVGGAGPGLRAWQWGRGGDGPPEIPENLSRGCAGVPDSRDVRQNWSCHPASAARGAGVAPRSKGRSCLRTPSSRSLGRTSGLCLGESRERLPFPSRPEGLALPASGGYGREGREPSLQFRERTVFSRPSDLFTRFPHRSAPPSTPGDGAQKCPPREGGLRRGSGV